MHQLIYCINFIHVSISFIVTPVGHIINGDSYSARNHVTLISCDTACTGACTGSWLHVYFDIVTVTMLEQLILFSVMVCLLKYLNKKSTVY